MEEFSKSVLDLSKLSFMVFPNRHPQASYLSEYQKAYSCWRSVWAHAFKSEMNVNEQLYSDNYSRQSHVAILLYDNEPACLATLNYFDLNDPVALDDSYFKVWPEITMYKIKQEALKIMACCNLTVNFNFRRGAYGLCWKNLIFAFIVRHLKSSSYDAVVGTARLEKSVEKAAYRTGAYPLHRDLPYSIEGQRIDLVCWSRNLDENIIEQEVWTIVNHVWNNSTKIIESSYFEQGEKNAA